MIYIYIRGKYQGIIGVVVAFGYAIGPLIGGALAEKVTWRVRQHVLTTIDDILIFFYSLSGVSG